MSPKAVSTSERTLAELGIDDEPPVLTSVERQATILDLLRARSGVYHDAARETPAMRSRRPLRGSHAPGSLFYYNNWDFNVLGAVFQKLTLVRTYIAAAPEPVR
jgi:CubicO group peptidase (beta-lactamase class C family)